MIKIYQHSKCGSCKKALQWLKKNEVEYKYFDIISQPPSLPLLKKAYHFYDKNIKKILNTSGKSYREKKDTLLQKKEEDILQEMIKDPMLIKRPLIVFDNKNVCVGFKEDILKQFN